MNTIKKIVILISGGSTGNPGGAFDALLMEDNSSAILLEDGSDILLER